MSSRSSLPGPSSWPGAALATAGPAGGSDRQAVAAFFPLAWVTEQVAGDDWEVTNLTRPGGEPHDLELGIAQTADLEEADVVVFERGFQPAVDDAVDTVAEGVVVDAAEVVDLRSLEEQHAADEHAPRQEPTTATTTGTPTRTSGRTRC